MMKVEAVRASAAMVGATVALTVVESTAVPWVIVVIAVVPLAATAMAMGIAGEPMVAAVKVPRAAPHECLEAWLPPPVSPSNLTSRRGWLIVSTSRQPQPLGRVRRSASHRRQRLQATLPRWHRWHS